MIRPVGGSKQHGFEEFCCQIAELEQDLEPQLRDAVFHRKGKYGDAGVECYYVLNNGEEWGWQAKYFIDRLEREQWQQIDESVRAAVEKHQRLTKYIVCIPINLSDPKVKGKKSQKDSWNDRVEKWTIWAQDKGRQVSFDKWEESALRSRLVKRANEKAGYILYWFDEKVFTPEWFGKRATEAIKDAGPRYTPEIHVDLTIAEHFDAFTRTNSFMNQFVAFADDLARRWKSIKPPSFLAEEEPELVDRINQLKDRIEPLRQALIQCSTQAFSTIDYEMLRSLAGALQEDLRSCLTMAGSRAHGRDSYLRELDFSVNEIVKFTYREPARMANQSVLLLVGSAGAGKTHLFCDVAKSRVDAGLPTILLLGEKFAATRGPWQQITEALLKNMEPEKLLGALDAAAWVSGRRALIMIDALNEGEGIDLWKRHLAGMVETLRQFPRVTLAVSCRDTYERAIIPGHMLSSGQITRVHHRGFEGHEYDATQVLFNHYEIESPNMPFLVPEFSNPLFLKLLCEGLHNKGLRKTPRELRGITKLFRFFVDSVNEKIAKKLGYDLDDRHVQRAVEELSRSMADLPKNWLEKSQAKEIVAKIRQESPSMAYERTLFRNLLHEGLLREDVLYTTGTERSGESTHKVIVSFAYQILADHLLVSHWLATLGLESSSTAFQSIESLRRLVSDKKHESGWITALAIEVPERTGQELMEICHEVKTRLHFPNIFLESLIYRKPGSTSDATMDYLNYLLKRGDPVNEIYDALLMISCEPESALNAKQLHAHLSDLNIADRDASWSVYLHGKYSKDEHGPIDRLIDWAWKTDTAQVDHDVVELCAIVLSWFLTSSDRFVRDTATKALVSLLKSRASSVQKLLERFHHSDDPYLLERLYAVAYGVAMVSQDDEAISNLASWIYASIFQNGDPPAHILLRDYARGVIELAAHRKVLPSHVDISKTIPPYSSEWPPGVPELKELETYGRNPETKNDPRWPTVWIYHHIMKDIDWADLIDHCCDDFTYVSPRDLSIMDMEVRNQSSERFLDRFDLRIAQRWIMKRVIELGRTADRFGEFDKYVFKDSYRGHAHHDRPESMGEKYAWIALHEFLAHLSDNVEFAEDTWGREPQEYCGPWQLLRRDIDPSFLVPALPKSIERTSEPAWWQPVAEVFDRRDESQLESWTTNSSDLMRMVELRDPDGHEWLALDSFFNLTEELPAEKDGDGQLRRNLKLDVRGYIVKKGDAVGLMKWLKTLKDEDFGKMPEPADIYQVFLGEYPWASSFKPYDMSDPWETGSYPDQPCPVIVTSTGYYWESGYDCSIEESINGLLPSAWLVRTMDLHWSGNGLSFADRAGTKVAFDPSAEKPGPSVLLVSKQHMLDFLSKNNLDLIWTTLEVRTVFDTSGYHWRTFRPGCH
jgi:hypothetical protein